MDSLRLPAVKTRDIELVEDRHLIGAFVGNPGGPTLIVIGSLHGNEPAGALALSRVSRDLEALRTKLNGRVFFLAGNKTALSKRVRFVDADLNRSWTEPNLSNIGSPELMSTSEGVELTELDEVIDRILVTAMDEVFVIDLHSTSAETTPFSTVGDTLRNREFAQKFPVRILLGVEEQCQGTMLEYLNNAGAVTLGFEGGQHDSSDTIANHISLVWLALVNAGILAESDAVELDMYRSRLRSQRRGSSIVEIRYREAISEGDDFEMIPGFNNFDPVTKGQALARNNRGPILATESGLIIMPLYQKLGNDGFFIARAISPFWLWLSGVLRGLGVQRFVHLLPGVRPASDDPATLYVNTRVARLLPLQIFHLLGFRRLRRTGHSLIVSRRRHDTSGPFRWEGDKIDGR